MDDAEFKALMAQAEGVAPKAQPTATDNPEAAPAAPVKTATELDAEGRRPDGTLYSEPPKDEPSLGNPDGAVEGFVGGAIKGVFEMKDFVFGDTKPEERTDFRANVEDRTKMLGQRLGVDGVAAGLGQFAVSMLGVGKFAKVAQLAKLPGAAKVGVGVREAFKAASAGVVGFDPHEERFSNMIQQTPLANFVTGYLQSDEDGSAFEGRMKGAIESLGIDAAFGLTLITATKVYKAFRSGNTEAAEKAVQQFEAQKATDIEAEQSVPTISDDVGAANPTAAPAVAGDGQPEFLGSPEPSPGAGPEGAAGSPGPVGGPEVEAGSVPGATAEAAVEGAPPSAAIAEEVTEEVPTITPGPAAAAAAEGVPTPTNFIPAMRIVDEDASGLIESMAKDAEAIDLHGSKQAAMEAGHVFGRGEGIPYDRLAQPQELDRFFGRVVDATEEKLNAMKGGAVLTDAKLSRLTDSLVEAYNVDPAPILKMLKDAGKAASNMPAQVEAGMLISRRMVQDLHFFAQRINMGYFMEYGTRDAALAEFKKRFEITASTYGSVRAMIASGGRTTRRGQFSIQFEDFMNVAGNKSAEQMVKMIADTGGDMRAAGRAFKAEWWRKPLDGLNFLWVNNLVSGPKTQLINLMSNSYMAGVRPLERMLGSAYGAATGDIAQANVFKEAIKQYTYMGTSFTEGFRYAVRTFMENDSMLAPHRTELINAGRPPVMEWKPWSSGPNILNNALKVGATGIGMPTRVLGFVDEAVKQTVYRSKIMAGAHIEGVQKGMAQGLTGDQLKEYVTRYVRDAADNSVDSAGRAVDAAALKEAQTATFSQDLLEGSFGRDIQSFVGRHPSLRLILPFVKTPSNVLRYGWKMTPGLNLLQKEYRDMLTGVYGAERKAQAVGQMALGTLYTGSAAFLVSNGSITGAGPRDPKTKAALEATGWQPYSVVVENEDGSKSFIPYNRYDPVAMPISIIADMMDAYTASGEDGAPATWEDTGGALLYAVASQMSSKTYLMGLQQFMDAMSDPGTNGDKLKAYMGQQAANLVPFSAALRQVNPDAYMHEARSMADRMQANVPGLSENVPKRFDSWGEPRLVRNGLWSTQEANLVDEETTRLGIVHGTVIPPASPNHNGVDLRELTLSTGQNAFERYQELISRPSPKAPTLKQAVAKVMRSKAYLRAPDGDKDTEGTKLWLLGKPVDKYRAAAMKRLKADKAVRDAFGADQKRVMDYWRTLASPPSGSQTDDRPALERLGVK